MEYEWLSRLEEKNALPKIHYFKVMGCVLLSEQKKGLMKPKLPKNESYFDKSKIQKMLL